MKTGRSIFLFIGLFILLFAVSACGAEATPGGASYDGSARKKAFMETPFYESGQVKVGKDDAVSELRPELTPFSVGDGYLYWTGETGKVEMITLEDDESAENNAADGQIRDKDAIVLVAEEWFDKAFIAEEGAFGSAKSVQVAGGEMSDYVVTVSLLWNEKETGNSASIVVSKTGKLQSAAFVYSALTAEDLGKNESVSEADVEQIVKDSIHAYIEQKTIIQPSEDDVIEIWETHQGAFSGVRYYMTKGQVLFSEKQKWGTNDMPFQVKVNADTGECMEVATILE